MIITCLPLQLLTLLLDKRYPPPDKHPWYITGLPPIIILGMRLAYGMWHGKSIVYSFLYCCRAGCSDHMCVMMLTFLLPGARSTEEELSRGNVDLKRRTRSKWMATEIPASDPGSHRKRKRAWVQGYIDTLVYFILLRGSTNWVLKIFGGQRQESKLVCLHTNSFPFAPPHPTMKPCVLSFTPEDQTRVLPHHFCSCFKWLAYRVFFGFFLSLSFLTD